MPFRHALLLSLILLAGCGGGGGGSAVTPGLPDPGLTNVVTEDAAARGVTIGRAGGLLTATGSNGVTYTLAVPPGALLDDTAIGMYPVTELTTLPGAAQAVAGVHFVPEGLVLRVPATLTADFPAGLNPSDLVALSYRGDAAELGIDLAIVDGQTTTMQIQHFSGEALAPATREFLDAFVDEASSNPAGFKAAMVNAFIDSPAGDEAGLRAALEAILVEWYTTLVDPQLLGGLLTTDEDQLLIHIPLDYEDWLGGVRFIRHLTPSTDFRPDVLEDSQGVAVEFLRHVYDVFNAKCVAQAGNGPTAPEIDNPLHSALAALQAGFWAERWALFPLNTNGLDRERLLADLCVQCVIEDASIIDGIEPGGTGNVALFTGYTIAGGAVRHDLPIRVKVTRAGLTEGDLLAPDSGLLQVPIEWPEGVNPLEILIEANIDTTDFQAIRASSTLTRSAPSSRPAYFDKLFIGTFSFNGTAGCGSGDCSREGFGAAFIVNGEEVVLELRHPDGGVGGVCGGVIQFPVPDDVSETGFTVEAHLDGAGPAEFGSFQVVVTGDNLSFVAPHAVNSVCVSTFSFSGSAVP